MNDTFVVGIVSVAVLGGAAGGLDGASASSILLLLIFGMLAGPDGVGLIPTEAMFGDLLLPLVAIAVAILLFEEGLHFTSLNWAIRLRVVGRLVTLGAAITWGLSALGAHYVLGLSWPLAVLIGSILTVTGPTVVMPLLRQIRPTGQAEQFLKWEGILIDPYRACPCSLGFRSIGRWSSRICVCRRRKDPSLRLAIWTAASVSFGGMPSALLDTRSFALLWHWL